MLPVRAFAESARRMDGRRKAAALPLLAWLALAVVFPIAAKWAVHLLGRTIAPVIGASVAGLLIFLGALAVGFVVVSLAAGSSSRRFSLGSSCARMPPMAGQPRRDCRRRSPAR